MVTLISRIEEVLADSRCQKLSDDLLRYAAEKVEQSKAEIRANLKSKSATDRQTDSQSDGKDRTAQDRQRQTETEIDRERERDRDREKDRQRHRKRRTQGSPEFLGIFDGSAA